MSDAFISYSRSNKLFADRLVAEMEKTNRSVWIDRAEIRFTTEWWGEIKRGIETCDNFVLIMSPEALGSPVCNLEIEYARQLTKRIIPLYHVPHEYKACKEHFVKRLYEDDKDGFLVRLYGDHNPMRVFEDNRSILPGINRVDAERIITTDADGRAQAIDEARFMHFFSSFREALDTDIVHVHQHTRLYGRAQEWIRGLKKSSFLLNGSETTEAEEWLKDWEQDSQDRLTKGLPLKNPQPDDTLREFIAASRHAEDEAMRQQAAREAQIRRFRRASVGLGVVGVLAVIAAVGASVVGVQAQQAAATATVAQGAAVYAQGTAIAQMADARVEQDIAVQLSNSGLSIIYSDNVGALQIADGIVDRHPDKALAYLSRGTIYSILMRVDSAIEDFSRAIELDPNFVIAYRNRGIAYNAINEYEKAIDDFTKASKE